MKLAIAIERYIDLKQQRGYLFHGGQNSLHTFARRLGDADLSHITTELISAYLDESDSACIHWQAKYGILYHFLSYWSDRGAMPELAMPAKRPKIRSTFVPYIFSRYQLRELLKATKFCHDRRDWIDVRTMRTLILLLYGTGAGTTEILELRFSDINLSDRLITIMGKGARHRQIPIGESLAEVMRKYISWRVKRKHSGSSFLITKYDQPIRRATASKHFEKIRKRAGVRRFDGAWFQPRLLDLRCTFAVHRITSWIKNGADLNRMMPALAAYMGQTGLGSTERYLALTPARFQKHLDKLSPERRRFHWRNDQALMRFLSSL